MGKVKVAVILAEVEDGARWLRLVVRSDPRGMGEAKGNQCRTL